jgi:hypothetical protein
MVLEFDGTIATGLHGRQEILSSIPGSWIFLNSNIQLHCLLDILQKHGKHVFRSTIRISEY